MESFLTFRKMVTPAIIQIIFWIGIALCAISGIAGIIGGAIAEKGGGVMVLSSLVWLVLGPIFIRVYCEIIILAFRIYDVLTEIKKNTERPTP
jgi:hypothetical protein